MGSCSNRNETENERLGRFAREVSTQRDTSNSDWQCSKGAEIRGRLGVEKGNQFIADMNKYK